jgi:hypothetical protein
VREGDAERTADALGIVCSMTSGNVSNFGTMCKPLHAGLAARNAVEASLWIISPRITTSRSTWSTPQKESAATLSRREEPLPSAPQFSGQNPSKNIRRQSTKVGLVDAALRSHRDPASQIPCARSRT